ncbi:hypothetical protein M9H77_18367 [Catharanthus roseus]|uniref:Uncharacterized protein n=1 Tax=Catharanthus roseus TaxID=4058 RepID=A0ACC0B7A2_CATRO|nr:hypothetical protein M9H77_18367 [Catharanthus roseus]
MHFGVDTTNPAESEHSVLKLWLSTCHGDLDTAFLYIDSLIQNQIAHIKSLLENSRAKEKFNAKRNPILRNISSGSGSGSGLGSGSGSSSRGRGRPPRAPRGKGRGCSRGRSSLSSVIDPSPCSTFPYTDIFPTFIYPFMEN